MKSLSKCFTLVVGLLAGLASAAPRAEAAIYQDAASWAAALSSIGQYGSTDLLGLPSYEAAYQDAFGTWTKGTVYDPVPTGLAAYPYNDPNATSSRGFMASFANPSVPGGLGATFTCYSNIYPCLGSYRVTFTLPYQIIGLTGALHLAADYWPGPDFMPELGGGKIVSGTAWKDPQSSYFFGALFDAPTNMFTVSWTGQAQTNLDLFASFALSNVQVVTVPEPASSALLGVGLIVLAGVARRRGAARLA
ncbi:PEP-CTERM sorting domain-containing protein [Roseomonas populi]|uniref:PEP-CTERM sorting domain-containing protein n=1 Tax=Roseomonas populi TaxID=3121582 RepID=A0ABT1X4I3_9PROT|nr:PEP-CTERM sorting domain-containing protein [Roseomonas pecuniae]MCR0982992.1 PEP-CTERM sorting domain-containing protein [Roseomonas pecuniae]